MQSDVNYRATGEYSNMICKYLEQDFPSVFKATGTNLIDILASIIIGTKETRYGSMPSIESQYTIRQVIQKSVDMNSPIPILIPWGGRKMDPSLKLDVAEVSGVKQLIKLNEQLKKFYSPGTLMNIRIEDANAVLLYGYESTEDVLEYSQSMVKLIKIFGDSNMVPRLESQMLTEKGKTENDYIILSELMSKYLVDVLTLKDQGKDYLHSESFIKLVQAGWKGDIPKEQSEYYLERYAKLYPNESRMRHIERLALYFGGSLMRYALGIVGNPASDYIQLNFSHPIPGVPMSMFNKTVYYRTVPESFGRTHVAPWRGQGYLQILGREVLSKVAHPGTTPDLTMDSIIITNGNEELTISVPYRVIDPVIPMM